MSPPCSGSPSTTPERASPGSRRRPGSCRGRVNEILNGKRDVARLDVFERIADGLGMPDDARQLLGLAPSYARKGGADPESLAEVTRVYRRQSDAAAEIQCASVSTTTSRTASRSSRPSPS